MNFVVAQDSPVDARISDEWNKTIRPLMEKHCGDCHMQTSNEGGMNLDDYVNLDKIRQHPSTWEQIRGVIRAEAMPPPKESQLKSDERTKLTAWIQSALHEVDCGCAPPPAPITLRRLNRHEYDNTVRDLLGLDIQPSNAISFVSDDVGNGFDNQGEVLTLPPIVLEKYMQAAAHIAKSTIETDIERLRTQRFEGDSLSFGVKKSFPLRVSKGTYQLQVRMRFGEKQPDTCKARILLGDKLVAEHDVATKTDGPSRNNNSFRHTLEIERGEHVLTIEYADDSEPEKRTDGSRKLVIESVRVTGPETGLPAFPPAHENFVVTVPEQKDAPEDAPIGFTVAVHRVFRNFLPKAYRRPVTADELHAVVSICEGAHREGFSYEESLQFGLQAVLVSPNFVFLNENSQPGKPLDDFGIASRLSYFLWSTMPDPLLWDLAEAGRLQDPVVLKQQVSRMLDSPKADAMLKGFFAQWLGLRNLNKIDIDREKFPIWNPKLSAAMLKETELFCGHVLRNGSLADFTSSSFTFVNPRLADFYGLQFEGKTPSEMYIRSGERRFGSERRSGAFEDEDKWIRVELEKNRKGLLTHAAVLALTSNPTRTSLVKRGKWVLENILGDPPPSAPPNVPSLEATEQKQGVSLRERLEIHRSNPSCAGCHKLMDPIGLGLENFDTIGRWREKDGDVP
ncbi:MAG: DUF1592 domain-containing protein, partial [Pirellula sp.]